MKRFSSIVICAFGLLSSQASSSAIIGNDNVILGVTDYANLNTPFVSVLGMAATDPTPYNYVGLRNGANTRAGDAAGIAASTEPGCLCEGWGFGASYLDAANVAQYEESKANAAQGGPSNLFLQLFTGNDGDDAAVSIVTDGNQALYQITHDFHIAEGCSSAVEVSVEILNIGAFDFTKIEYVRAMDWDIYPTYFDEYVTIQGVATTDDLVLSHDDGFEDTFPSATTTEINAGTTNVDFIDNGPNDHGAYFKFDFGALAVDARFNFSIFYGVEDSESDALECLSGVNAELYTLGQSNSGDAADNGSPYTFFFAFSGVGGDPMNCKQFTCPNEPTLCENSPCDCDEVESSDFDENCHACHSNGCNQCNNGYFKVDYDHSCANCNEYFGDGCMFCQDFNGCGQCKSGYQRIFDEDCGLWYCDDGSCTPNADTSATQCEDIASCAFEPCNCGELEFCSVCHGNGCDQCNNGYFKKDYNTPCINCQQVFGAQCMSCQDFNGCAQCTAGYNRVYNSDCGLWECQSTV